MPEEARQLLKAAYIDLLAMGLPEASELAQQMQAAGLPPPDAPPTAP